MIDGVIFTPLPIIDTDGGDVLHVMKANDPCFSSFGEAYFSNVEPNAIKGWKLHREMVLNLVVPVGAVKFVILDDREVSNTQFQEVIISKDNYSYLWSYSHSPLFK